MECLAKIWVMNSCVTFNACSAFDMLALAASAVLLRRRWCRHYVIEEEGLL